MRATPPHPRRVFSLGRDAVLQVFGSRFVAEAANGHCQLGLLLAELPYAQLPRIPVFP